MCSKKSTNFFIIQTILLIIIIILVTNASPLQTIAEETNTTCIVHQKDLFNQQLQVKINNETIPLYTASCRELVKADKLVFSGNETISIPFPINPVIEVYKNLLIIYNNASRPSIEVINCNIPVEENSYYLIIKSNLIKKNQNMSMDLFIVKSNKKAVTIPVKALYYSIQNNTIYIPPAKCSSPPNQMINEGDIVLFKVSTDKGAFLIVYENHEGDERPIIIQKQQYNTSTTTSLPAYSPTTIIEKEKQVKHNTIYLASLVTGSLILLAMYYKREK